MEKFNFMLRKYGEKSIDDIYKDICNGDMSVEDYMADPDENPYGIEGNDYCELINALINLAEEREPHLYKDDEFGKVLELNDNHTLWEINSEKFNEEDYYRKVNDAASKFAIATDGVELLFLGRSARHVCVKNTVKNAMHFEEFCRLQQKLEDEVIEYFK